MCPVAIEDVNGRAVCKKRMEFCNKVPLIVCVQIRAEAESEGNHEN